MNNMPVPDSNETRPESPLIRLSGVSANSTGKTKSSTRTRGPILGVLACAGVAVGPAVNEPVGVAAGVSIAVPVGTCLGLVAGVAVVEVPQATVAAIKTNANTTMK